MKVRDQSGLKFPRYERAHTIQGDPYSGRNVSNRYCENQEDDQIKWIVSHLIKDGLLIL